MSSSMKMFEERVNQNIYFNFFEFHTIFHFVCRRKQKTKIRNNSSSKKQKRKKKSILFLFRSLFDAKTKYWFIELKIKTLIWIFIKFFQYFDVDSFTMITNHFALKNAFQTNTINKRSTRLNDWIMYLSTFFSKMIIIHRIEKIHQNANNLSRLSTKNVKMKIFFNTIIADDDNLLKKIANELFKNKIFAKITKKLKNQMKKTKNEKNNFKTKYQFYKMNSKTNLFYFKNKFHSDKLCISKKNQKCFLQYAHDEHAHGEIHRTYDLLYKSMFIFKMKKMVTQYVIACSICQFSKLLKQLPYEKLQLLKMPTESLTKLFLNFIVALFMIFNDNNVIMSITDRFTKYVKTISSNEKMKIEKWRYLY